MDNRERIADLGRKAWQGSQEAFNELYRLTRDRAYFVAFTIAKEEQDALDILQDSFLKAWQHIGDLQAPWDFGAWLKRIVGNTAKDFIKQRKPLMFQQGREVETDILDLQVEKDSEYTSSSSGRWSAAA